MPNLWRRMGDCWGVPPFYVHCTAAFRCWISSVKSNYEFSHIGPIATIVLNHFRSRMRLWHSSSSNLKLLVWDWVTGFLKNTPTISQQNPTIPQQYRNNAQQINQKQKTLYLLIVFCSIHQRVLLFWIKSKWILRSSVANLTKDTTSLIHHFITYIINITYHLYNHLSTHITYHLYYKGVHGSIKIKLIFRKKKHLKSNLGWLRSIYKVWFQLRSMFTAARNCVKVWRQPSGYSGRDVWEAWQRCPWFGSSSSSSSSGVVAASAAASPPQLLPPMLILQSPPSSI